METFTFNNRSYAVDEYGFLTDPKNWDANYAEGMAREAGIAGGLDRTRAEILSFIRTSAAETGRCPAIRKVCGEFHLKLADFMRLFPAGYEMGACKLAGLTSFPWAGHTPRIPSRGWDLGLLPMEERIRREDEVDSPVHPLEWEAGFAV